jgi:sugar (pentulose or hexulose) kinase
MGTAIPAFNIPFLSMMEAVVEALLAGIATGVFRHPAEGVGQFVKPDKVFEPDPVRHRIYQQKLEAYGELFPLLRGFLAKLERGTA